MGEFTAKPVTVEARQWDGTQAAAATLVSWILDNHYFAQYETTEFGGFVVINTPCGPMHTSAGDWIVMGPSGAFHPYNPDIFAATYDPV